jgi:hypothetical protein
MHIMLKRAAASAIPALVGLAIYPATAMAAPQTSHVTGGTGDGVIAFSHGSTLFHNHVFAEGAPAIDNSHGGTAGNGIVGTAGNSVRGHVFAHVSQW